MNPTDVNLGLLCALGAELNELIEDLNKYIATFERKINAANLGVEVWLNSPINESSPDPFHETAENQGHIYAWDLGYAKLDDGWHVAARQVTIKRFGVDRSVWGTLEESEPIPLSTAPQSVRVEATGHFEGLVDALATRVRGWVARIEGAKHGGGLRQQSAPDGRVAPPKDGT